jgi:HAE1 family hydrophobic/amphiphilic exporter-1
MGWGMPGYSVVWGSMATTLVAGLATATFRSLFIVPAARDRPME